MARKRKGEDGGDAAALEPEVHELPGGDVVFPDPDAHDWSYFGTDRDGRHYDVCRVTGERRVRSGDPDPAQAAWLAGKEWDTSLDAHAEDEALVKERRKAEREEAKAGEAA